MDATPQKTTFSSLSQWGGRRFLLTLGAGVVDTLLLVGGYLDQATYATLTLATVGAYIGSSTFQQITEKKNGPSGVA